MTEPLRVLSRRDVAGLLGFADYVGAVEQAFRLLAEAKADAPAPLHLHGDGGAFHVKAAGLPLGRRYVAVKINGNFPRNSERFALPTIQGAILLLDGERGMPLALMDSIEITIGRTGAATAVAARLLARPDAAVATIAGCGVQGRIQLRALRHVLPLERAWAYDRDAEIARRFAREMSTELGLDVQPVTELHGAAIASDAVVTCTTAHVPILGVDDVRSGAFVAAVGADNPEKQELAPELMARAKVIVDVLDQCAVMGDLHHAIGAGVMRREDVHAELGEVLAGQKPGRATADEIVVFDSTGTAIQDVAAAALAYERAVEADVGARLGLA